MSAAAAAAAAVLPNVVRCASILNERNENVREHQSCMVVTRAALHLVARHSTLAPEQY